MDLLARCLRLEPEEREIPMEGLVHSFFSREPGLPPLCRPEKAEAQLHYLTRLHRAFLSLERSAAIPASFLSTQKCVSERMRRTLVEWLNDVAGNCDMSDQCFFLAVNYLDRYLAQKSIEVRELQLLGTACLKTAEYARLTRTFCEISKEQFKLKTVEEYSFLTAHEYSSRQILQMEQALLGALGLNLQVPTALHFLELYIELIQKVAEVYCTEPLVESGRFGSHSLPAAKVQRGYLKTKLLLESAAFESTYVCFAHSTLASAALYLGLASEGLSINPSTLSCLKEALGQRRPEAFEQAANYLASHWSDLAVPGYINLKECPFKKYLKKHALDLAGESPPRLNFFACAWFDC